MVDAVRNSGARILFVGLGCPRQEVFAFEARDAVSMPTIAVGAAFPFHAGALAQAPPLMQRWGLEWLFRLVQEPRRLWRRYLLLNPAYLTLLALQKLSLHNVKSHELDPPDTQLLYG
jgi:exopolysaccharide biosynthesis WecB/TagA/CpsF family protein